MNTALNLSSFVSLRLIDDSVSNVWLTKLPKMPWKHAAAVRERKALLDALTAAFPFRWIWLSDWATGELPRWQQLAKTDGLFGSCEGLDNGGWMLLFFQSDQDRSIKPWNVYRAMRRRRRSCFPDFPRMRLSSPSLMMTNG